MAAHIDPATGEIYTNWNMAMEYLRAHVRSLETLEGYEFFEGTDDEPELLVHEGTMEEDISEFIDEMKTALEQRARELNEEAK